MGVLKLTCTYTAFFHSKFWNRLKPGDEQKDKYTVQPGLSAEELYHQSKYGEGECK